VDRPGQAETPGSTYTARRRFHDPTCPRSRGGLCHPPAAVTDTTPGPTDDTAEVSTGTPTPTGTPSPTTPTGDTGTTVPPPQSAQCDACLSNSHPDAGGDLTPFNVGFCSDASPEPYDAFGPLCADVRDCVVDAGCVVENKNGTTTWHGCYCGVDKSGDPLTVEVCTEPGFTPAGPCVAEIDAGMGADTPDASELLKRWFDDGYPAGMAFLILNDVVTEGICQDSCGL